MKSSLAFAAIALSLGLSAAAAPFERRAGVTCTKKYVGNLHFVRLTSGKGAQFGVPNDPIGLRGERQYLSTLSDLPAQRFQFDECKTDGWNDEVKEYGQIKPLDTAGGYTCVTAASEPNYAQINPLNIQQCGDYNGGVLNQQWFYANYIGGGDNLAPRVEFTLTGNPNDPSRLTTFGRTQDSDGAVVGAEPLNSPVPTTMALFDVEIVS
ncbi:unnamed protein product [Parajaminaea phylloscopi]